MAGVVGVWFAKFGREAAPAAEAEAEVVGRRHQGDALLEVEAVKKGGVQIQERRRRTSAVLANSEDTKNGEFTVLAAFCQGLFIDSWHDPTYVFRC
ncbi:hypothetical protein TRIUR3_15747 [Triticum urartu]|uniref:Uncharacterized protein n=1 Tax=Triticum urartu TaxID=4572 RepID=M7ZCG3_TRIUA|nr:hypothetical protein TRIUR3_15747 [Triticum urartu]